MLQTYRRRGLGEQKGKEKDTREQQHKEKDVSLGQKDSPLGKSAVSELGFEFVL